MATGNANPQPKAQLRTERTRSGLAGMLQTVRTSKHRASQRGHEHHSGERVRRQLPETATGVPPRARLHAPLSPVLPMTDTARLAGYWATNGRRRLTGAQNRRRRQKLNRADRTRALSRPRKIVLEDLKA